MQTKVCSRCGRTLELNETNFYFYKGRAHNPCLECKAEYMHNYYKERYSPEQRKKEYQENKESAHEYYLANLESRKDYQRSYYSNNKEKIAEYFKRPEVKDRARDCRHEFYERNKDKILAYEREWRINNPEKALRNGHIRRDRKRKLPCTLTLSQWEQAQNYFSYRCAYCGRTEKLEKDHFVPLTLGGGFTQDNIIPSCRSCNSRKHNTPFADWYPRQAFYTPEREAKILNYIKEVSA